MYNHVEGKMLFCYCSLSFPLESFGENILSQATALPQEESSWHSSHGSDAKVALVKSMSMHEYILKYLTVG